MDFTRLIITIAFAAILGIQTSEVRAQPSLSAGADMPMQQRAVPVAGDGNATLASLSGANGTVIVFWSNQCPWVDKYEDRVLALASNVSNEAIAFIFVNSNDPSAFPEESREVSAERAADYSYVHYLMDPGSEVAVAFGAQRTPHVFVFDGGGALVYEGAIDDSPGDPSDVQEAYLENVLTALVQGQAPSVASTRSFGCTIKFQ